ncbi:putative 5-azacytidine-induced protein 1-like [Scophthalmus maximus]|uniref:Putative 5-azacytidine-induced protein 1-like n=1 Tax=Scophthalmus maximus TaxID=52904 RepID=A0A2U9CNL8_SCOMX|nr:putative 5-azacytidine-induced protein 1-like [Scophthalmus maximus]
MHTTRSPSSIPTSVSRDALDLSLSGSQLSVSRRPSSASSPGKSFSRSVSVSVAAGDSRGKRNTLGSDASFGSSRSIKNLRRSNSTTQVNQQGNISLSREQSDDYLALFDSSSDGRKKLSGLGRASPDRTTWNILDDQPRAFALHSSSRSTGSVDSPTGPKRREPGIALAATFTANNRSNKGAVGNSVTTILHNNYSEKPLTPKSSNQKPSFNNILKATANDEVVLENGSVTKSQKNFSSSSFASNNRSPVSAQHGSPRRREVTEEEAERFIQQVNQAAVTIQRWYRRHAAGRHANQAALKRILASKRKEWEERTEEDGRPEQQQQKRDEDRKRIREEKARLARLAAIQELHQKRSPPAAAEEEEEHAAETELEGPRQTGMAGRKKPPRISLTHRSPAASPSNNSPAASPTVIKSKNTESNLNIVADFSELRFRAISPAPSNPRGSQCSLERDDRVVEDICPEQQQHLENDRKSIRKEKTRLIRLAAAKVVIASDEPQQQRHQRVGAEADVESPTHTAAAGRKRPPKILPTQRSRASPSNNGPMSPTDVKTQITAELSFRVVSPASSNRRGSPCSQEALQRSVSAEDQRQAAVSGRAPSKTTLTELLDTLKLLEEEPTRADTTSVPPVCFVRGGAGWRGAGVGHRRRESPTHTAAAGRKRPPKILPTQRSRASPSNNGPMSPTDVKTQITAELSFRVVSPASSNRRGSPCSQEALQRSVSAEDQRQAAVSGRAPSKTTLTELLDTLKLLEEEPVRLSEPKCYHNEKYAWIDEDEDSNSLTTDNLELHRQLSHHHPALPDGGALLSEAKLQSIMSFLDEMEKSEQERPRSVTSGSHREFVLSEEELAGVEQASATAAEVTGSMMRIKLELEEKKRMVNMLQAALAQQRELTVRHVKETEKELNRNLQLQKEQYEATIQRHLTFIDQLINDKKSLSERCEGVVGELKQVDQKYTKKISQMQEQHEMVWQILGPLCEEIKKLKDLMSATEKIRREKWIDEKTKKIKEITVKGLEPEIQKLISKHKQELKKLRTLHEAELLQADDRAAQRYVRQCEELRQQLEREKDEQCQRERDLTKHRYEQQLQEEELSLQQQRRRLYKEVADEKERLAQLAARQRVELEDLRRQLEENSSLAGRALREELDKSREEQERRHQVEMRATLERLDIEKQTWEENYKKKKEAWLLSRERELKEELRRERDKEIDLAIWTLEEETSKDKEECERAADSRVKRLREKYEAELRELERSERAAVEKHQELRKQQLEAEGETMRLQAVLRQKEREVEDITQTRDKLADERRSLAEVIRQEFAERLVTTEEENRRMKVEVSEVRARLRLEVERVTREKEEELAEVHQRVKSAILKKEETVNNLRKQHEAAVKRADHLEALWEQQRRQLLEK